MCVTDRHVQWVNSFTYNKSRPRKPGFERLMNTLILLMRIPSHDASSIMERTNNIFPPLPPKNVFVYSLSWFFLFFKFFFNNRSYWLLAALFFLSSSYLSSPPVVRILKLYLPILLIAPPAAPKTGHLLAVIRPCSKPLKLLPLVAGERGPQATKSELLFLPFPILHLSVHICMANRPPLIV